MITNINSDLREQSMVDAWNKTTDSLNNLMNIYINNNIKQENEKINTILDKDRNNHTCNLRNYENLYSHSLQIISLIFFTTGIFRLFHIYKIKNIKNYYCIIFIYIKYNLYNIEIISKWKVIIHQYLKKQIIILNLSKFCS